MLKPSRLSFIISLIVMGLLINSWVRAPKPSAFQGEPGWILIQSAQVFDGVHPSLSAAKDILIHDGIIVSVDAAGQTLPAGTQILPAHGLTLMPSFTDLGNFPSLQGNFADEKIAGLAAQALHYDLGSGVGALIDLSSSLAQSEMSPGRDLPALQFAGPTLSTLGGWRPGPLGDSESPVLEISDEGDLQHALRVLHSSQAQVIFLSMENIALEDPPFSEDEMSQLGDMAKIASLPIFAYAPHTAQVLRALKCHPRLILGPLAYEAVDGNFIQAMKDAHCAYAPALNSLLVYWPWPHGLARLESLSEAMFLSPSMLSSLSDPDLLGRRRQALNASGASADLALKNCFQLWQAGISIGLASFSGRMGIPHGLGARSEISFLLDAGLPLPAIMRLATSDSATLGGFEGSGQVKAGFQANLMLVKGDPLKDPEAHQRVRMVLRQGKIWIPRELRKL